jgi:hypothetical protein
MCSRKNLPQGNGEIEMLCVYEKENGLIKTAYFSFG